jgi:hypothetical protein
MFLEERKPWMMAFSRPAERTDGGHKLMDAIQPLEDPSVQTSQQKSEAASLRNGWMRGHYEFIQRVVSKTCFSKREGSPHFSQAELRVSVERGNENETRFPADLPGDVPDDDPRNPWTCEPR